MMQLKRRKKPRMGVRTPERVRSVAHMAWVRKVFECAVYNDECSHRTEAHHVRVDGEGTTGKRPGDDTVVPLCSFHHASGHATGWRTFEERYRVDLTEIARGLWRNSPHRIAWERKQAGIQLRAGAERFLDEMEGP